MCIIFDITHVYLNIRQPALMLSTRRFLSAQRAFAARALSSTVEKPFTIGILAETYDKWERRAPLCPNHVQEFLSDHNSSAQVLVQPSANRIFSNAQYAQAGATVQEDLSQADLIVGVKKPKYLVPNTTYMFFSHVLKGQAENMGLLQEILHKNISLLDYECMVQEGMQTTDSCRQRKRQRILAFGRFAGMAGMMDTFGVLGRRLLTTHGVTTPFLHCPSAVLHANLQQAKESVKTLGERIAAGELTLEQQQQHPLIFCRTGRGGQVHAGVQEIFDLLPHEMVSLADLPHVANLPGPHHKVYGISLATQDLYQHIDNDRPFDRADFGENPQNYQSIFASQVAPYIDVLVNGIYWDPRFPRLLTKQDVKDLYESGNRRLVVACDISCDIGGSLEFLERSTTIDRPCFTYDPLLGREIVDDVADGGITVMGVDILPTELPVESSQHFGDVLSGYLKYFVHGNDRELPKELDQAFITKNGQLTNSFKYLQNILDRTPAVAKMSSYDHEMTLVLDGHLFDSGLINQVLDTLEQNDCGFEFLECFVRPKTEDGMAKPSRVVLQVSSSTEQTLDVTEKKITALVQAIEKAQATLETVRSTKTSTPSSRASVVDPPKDKVLVLGSGHVAGSTIEYLGRDGNRRITVASNNIDEAKNAASHATNTRALEMDLENRPDEVARMVQNADIVVSLLPAPLHPQVATQCIYHKKDLVTASYESDDMRALALQAEGAGIRILNEVGLDPGLDHASSMKILDDIHGRGGEIQSFVSVCGGLPSPEAASSNPLKYKFSWSPMGVIRASQSAAKYKWEGRVLEVFGNELLLNASPFVDAWPDLHLECLPNRNSLAYRDVYGIKSVDTIFRGTLRYRGFSDIMHTFQNMGLFETTPSGVSSWEELLTTLRKRRGGIDGFEEFLLACAEGDEDVMREAATCLKMLGVSNGGKIDKNAPVVQAFCNVLEETFQYTKEDRDLVLMHHEVVATFPEMEVTEKHQSSLELYGNPRMSAMAKSVGYTTGAATNLLLDRHALTGQVGLLLPTKADIYQPLLDAVRKEGISFTESVSVVPHSLENHEESRRMHRAV